MPQLEITRNSKKFYHYTFELRKANETVYTHTLLVNPEDLSINEPAKVNVVQTLGGAYVEDFGQGLPVVSISGSTGFTTKTSAEGKVRDGWVEFRDFRENVYRKFLYEKSKDYALYWYNWEDDEYFLIQPTNFRTLRNRQAPTMYRYEFQFTCLKRLTLISKITQSEKKTVKLQSLGDISTELTANLSRLFGSLSSM